MITPQNLPRHELIGLKAEVVSSTNKANVGLKGKVVDESLRTFVLETAEKETKRTKFAGLSELRSDEKRIFKNQCKMQFTLPDGKKVELPGSLLEARPWDRVKRKIK